MGKRDKRLIEHQAALTAQSSQWWYHACGTARHLAAGGHPPVQQVHGVVLQPDEQLHLSTQIGYSRYYARGDGSWARQTTLAVGPTSFVAGAMLGNAIANSRAANAARANATMMWREQQRTGILITDRRVLCHSAGRGTWLSFWFNGVSEFYPDLSAWTTVCAFEQGDPLRLEGPENPLVALWCARGILGDSWMSDPRLAPLLQ
ncbi:hypothetical protein [Jongsikchunia kroppenstedtii]|uniref:hypothetical protein n=1 Tax=Jongsikchunia kroppenstedtii TaxID=1121721 RepID=UPI00037F233D|nr:hypothetical protein [Jongsikchunia kroppenstedtii]